MKRRKEKARTIYGEYTIPVPDLDRDVFKLRLEALRRHEGFLEYCTRPDIEDLERDVMGAWGDAWICVWEWFSKGRSDYEKCLLMYGNVHRLHGQTLWTWHCNAYRNYQIQLRVYPFMELRPGVPGTGDMLTISIDPRVRRNELVRMFENFLTARRKAAIKTAEVDPFRGYFHVTEKRFNPELVERYFTVHALREKHPKTWRLEAEKAFPGVFTGPRETGRRRMYRDIESAANIIAWVVKGRFPCTKPLE